MFYVCCLNSTALVQLESYRVGLLAAIYVLYMSVNSVMGEHLVETWRYHGLPAQFSFLLFPLPFFHLREWLESVEVRQVL